MSESADNNSIDCAAANSMCENPGLSVIRSLFLEMFWLLIINHGANC